MPTDGTDITALDERTVERIAAGEVVERPASVVKELVENAIDAGATRVEVAVDAGGTEGIRVTDDGAGMTEGAVRQAVRQHTTSKISDVADLEGGVGTLGFRGEALHAIGAVSRLTLRSRPQTDAADPGQGTELRVEGGTVADVSPAGCPPGTTVEVADLFYNVPARRKYLKQDATEFAHVTRVVGAYALANPGVAVSLSHDGRETFATPGSGDRREAVMAVYGREVATAMLPVDPGELPAGPLTDVSGLVSHPETNRASRDYLSTFVNGRYVTASQVRDAVVDAYDTQLAPDRYPFAVLDLAVDPATVDVNVHPRKLEVRFADAEAVREQVRAAVDAALMREGLVRSRAPRGRSAPDEAAVRPGTGGDTDGPSAGGPDPDPGSGTDADPGSPATADGTRAGRESAADAAARARDRSDVEPAAPPARSHEGTDDRGPAADRKFTPPHEQTRLGEGEGARAGEEETAAGGQRTEYDALPAMRVLGQVGDTYVAAETAEGLVLVDQHAADERVNYERLLDAFEGPVTSQALATPVRVSLTPGEAAVFEAREAALGRLGFRAELAETDGDGGEAAVAVTAVPSLVAGAADPDLLREVLGALLRGEAAAAETVEAAREALLADLACYPSVTGNTSLAEGSVVALLSALDDCENPWACPHGRPTVVELDRAEIEARFERDYPGHGG